MRKGLRVGMLCVIAMTAMALTGCNNYNRKSAGYLDAYNRGDMATATLEINKSVAESAERDKLVRLLEQGAILRTAGQTEASTQAFEAADTLFAKYDEKAKIRVGREAYAAVTNLSWLDYEGYGYDRIMMNVYKAMNFLEAGNLEQARIEIKRVAQSQEMTKQRWASKIESAEKAKAEKDTKTKYDVEKGSKDPKLQAAMDKYYADLPEVRDLSTEALYANPFAEYLQALFGLYGGDSSDREIGRVALRNVSGMIDNPYVKQDLAIVEKLASGFVQPTTYVIYEMGVAPRRSSFPVVLPLPLGNGRLIDFQASFPYLLRQPTPFTYLSVTADGKEYQTAVLADIDAIVGREFKNELPAVITRTLIASTVKAAAGYAVRESMRNQGTAGQLGALVATVGYNATMNEADLRTWRTLPKQIHVARVPTPANRQLSLSLPGGVPVSTIEVQPGVVNIVHVKNTGLTVPYCVIRQFKLK